MIDIRLLRDDPDAVTAALARRGVDPSEVERIVEGLSIYLLPLANPDGRVWTQAPHGDPMWRKNRAPNPASPRCVGVDINRNFDFIWSAGLTASAEAERG